MLSSLNKREDRREGEMHKYECHILKASGKGTPWHQNYPDMGRVPLLLPTCGETTWLSVPSSLRKGSGLPWLCTADSCKQVLPGEPVRGGQV